MPRLILNAIALPEQVGDWIQIAPTGEHRHGEYIQVIDAESMATLQQNFRGPVHVDFDHRSYEHSSEAAGWISELDAREDGLYAKVEWTDVGQAALNGKRYRWVSPTWTIPAKSGKGKVRPEQLLDVALTNRPNLQVPPLFNQQSKSNMEEINKALGLDPQAESSTAVAKIQEILADREALQNNCNDLKGQVQSLQNAQVEADLIALGDRIQDKDAARKLLLNDRDTALKVLSALPARQEESPAAKETLSNSKELKSPKSPNVPDAKEQADLVESIRLENKCTYQQAWNEAIRRKPELFNVKN